MSLAPKPFFRHGERIGEVATWSQAIDLLVERGMPRETAENERMTLGVEGPREFHIVAPKGADELCAETRRILGAGDG